MASNFILAAAALLGAASAAPASSSIQSFGGSNASSYHSPAFVPWGQSLRNALSQQQTNGRSTLGTFSAPKLPGWLSGSPMPQGRPWGGRTCRGTDQYTDVPNTGVTRFYNFDVSYQTIAPDGVEMEGIVVNGAFPGPTIEANWGDWIEVRVTNNLANEGTAMHWHGLLQANTPWMDGVPAVTQCPIAPGQSFTYRFQADLYGTSWYHSHYSAQYSGGAIGPMIIYGPNDTSGIYDEDLGPILLTDWFHDHYYDLVEQVMAPASEGLLPPLSNNNLINGKMNYPCEQTNRTCTPNAGISKFKFESGKKYRLRLINGGAEAIQHFSIDGYTMTVIANDFVPVNPYQTNKVTLGIGQRTDVIVQASGKPTDAVWMRSQLGPSAFAGGCSLPDGISPDAVAAIYYQNANTSALPTTTSDITTADLTTCSNDDLSLTTPAYPITPEVDPGITHTFNISYGSNGTNDVFFVNGSSFRGDYNNPILLQAKLGNNTFEDNCNVYSCQQGTSTRVVLYNYAQTGAHPMHMHGHNVFVLAEGYGEWDGSVTNANNPQRRDVQLLWNAKSPSEPSYVVLQFTNDNPGSWPLHCHIAWHVSAGLYVTLLEGKGSEIESLQIPSTSAQVCRSWAAWTGANVPDQIDSGL